MYSIELMHLVKHQTLRPWLLVYNRLLLVGWLVVLCFLLLVVGGCFLQPPTTNQQTNKLNPTRIMFHPQASR